MENCKKCQTELVAKGSSDLFRGRRDESLEICPNCYEQCPNCGNWYDKGDLTGSRNGQHVCDGCDLPNTVKLSDMSVGDYCIYNGDVCRLKDGGKSGGCDHDLYLAYVCDCRDDEQRDGIDSNLPALIVDRDDVSGIDD